MFSEGYNGTDVCIAGINLSSNLILLNKGKSGSEERFFFPLSLQSLLKKNSVRNGEKSFVLLLGSANLVTLRNWGLMVSRTLG